MCTGPQYCNLCADTFRSHILQTAVRQETCSRENPCAICKQIVAHLSKPLPASDATPQDAADGCANVAICSICTTIQPSGAPLNRHWKKHGYAGPAYCFTCAANFRSHIIRERLGRKTAQSVCSRATPCLTCSRILELCIGERAQVFAAIDAHSARKLPPAVKPEANVAETKAQATEDSTRPAVYAEVVAWDDTAVASDSHTAWSVDEEDALSDCSSSDWDADSTSTDMPIDSSFSEWNGGSTSEHLPSPGTASQWDLGSTPESYLSDSSLEWGLGDASPTWSTSSAATWVPDDSDGMFHHVDNPNTDGNYLDSESGDHAFATASTSDHLSSGKLWPPAHVETVDSGTGYVVAAKRFATKAIPVVALVSMVSVAVNLAFLLHGQADAAHTTSVDTSGPPIRVQCGRSIEQYMVDIDRVCCGDAMQDLNSPWCSVGSRRVVDGHKTDLVWSTHNLFVCTDSCSELVLPLWSQCIQPELRDQYPSIEESPAWLFQSVVAKCSQQPVLRRRTCVDDNSLVDPISYNFTNSKSSANTSADAPRSLCREVQSGLLKCNDLLGPDGKFSDEYPAGWYDDGCCQSCPVYWPRILLAELEARGQKGGQILGSRMLTLKATFQEAVAAMEGQQNAILG